MLSNRVNNLKIADDNRLSSQQMQDMAPLHL